MLLFQFDGVAEQWLSADDWANFATWAGHPDHDGRGGRARPPGPAHGRAELVPGQHPA